MSREFKPEVSEAVIKAMADCYDPTWGYPDASIGKEWASKSIAAALAAMGGQPDNLIEEETKEVFKKWVEFYEAWKANN